jgi:hypothetical protein
MTTYLVHGFHRQDHKQSVCMVVDLEDALRGAVSPHSIAGQIAGPEFCFHVSMNVSVVVPDEHKNVLLTEPELYARVPELDLTRRAKQRRRRS